MKAWAVLLFALAATAQPQWSYLETSDLAPATFTPQAATDEAITAAPDGSYWVAGRVTVANGWHGALGHFSADGTPLAIRYNEPVFVGSAPFALTSLGDGGVAALTNTQGSLMNPICEIARFGADARTRWKFNIGTSCSLILGHDVDGAILMSIYSGAVFRIAADGGANVGLDALLPGPAVYAMHAQGREVYAAYGNPFASTPTTTTVVRIDPDLSVHTLWQSTANDVAIDQLAVDAAGNVDAAGHTADGHAAVLSLSPQGQLRWQHSETLTSATPGQLETLADGTLVHFDRNGSLFAVAGSDGHLVFSTQVVGTPCDGSSVSQLRCLRVAPNGDLIVLDVGASDWSVLRFDSSGHPLASVDIAGLSSFSFAALADNSVVIASSDGGTVPALQRFDRTGTAAAVPAEPIGVVSGSRLVALDDDGATQFLLTQDQTDYTENLSRVNADGTLAWQRKLATLYSPALARAAGRLCVADFYQPSVACYAAADGTPLWQWSLADSVPAGTETDDYAVALGVLADGSVDIVTQGTAVYHMRHLDPNGVAAFPFDVPGAGGVGFSPDGYVVATDNSMVRSYRPDGSLLYAVPLPVADNYAFYHEVSALPGGAAVIAAIIDTASDVESVVWGVGSDGSLRWSRTGDAYAAESFAVDADTVYVQTSSKGVVTLQSLALADGTVHWKTDVQPQQILVGATAVDIHLSTTTQRVVMPWLGAYAAQALSFDAHTGTLAATAVRACDGQCLLADASAADDGSLHLATGSLDGVDGARVRLDAVTPSTTAVPVLQDGVDGAWYAPYESGQGFVVDHIGSANTLAMAWFTYSQFDLGLSDASLAWYTLQGSADANASSADLTLFATDPGSFVSGTVATHAVGTAHLRFSDCNTGELQYQFNADTNGGQAGYIALSRLSPSNHACQLADGSTTPAQNANPPANGFDAGQSGSWYDPSTSGQGLEISITPAGNGNAGLAFGAWFTFDPAGHGDDARQQHWFTLQGDLAGASGGKVVLPMYRTIGGTLDGMPTRDIARVGAATLTFADCTHASLDYAFDSSATARTFNALAGHVNLVKIGGCSTP